MIEEKATGRIYDEFMSEDERKLMAEARLVEGLDEEIALIRVRLARATKERPEDLRLLRDGVTILARAVATRYRLSPRAKQELADSMAAVLNSLGDQILPADQ